MAEQSLIELDGLRVAIASIGPKRWPGEVTASLGPRMRGAREAGLVVGVDLDRRLQVTGLTQAPLPKPLLRAAAELLRLVHPLPVRAPSCRRARRRGYGRREQPDERSALAQHWRRWLPPVCPSAPSRVSRWSNTIPSWVKGVLAILAICSSSGWAC
jgi:hypothetical protein